MPPNEKPKADWFEPPIAKTPPPDAVGDLTGDDSIDACPETSFELEACPVRGWTENPEKELPPADAAPAEDGVDENREDPLPEKRELPLVVEEELLEELEDAGTDGENRLEVAPPLCVGVLSF